MFLEGDSGFFEKKFDTINENPTPAQMKLYSAICQRILAGNEKKKTDDKTTDHEKKKTPIANKEKHQYKVPRIKIKLKNQKNDGEEHGIEDEVQVIKGTREKKAVVGRKMDIEKAMKFYFVIEWDEPKEQVYEAMTLNAKDKLDQKSSYS